MKPNWPTSIFECDKQIRSRFSIYRAWAVINSHWEPSLPNAPGKDKTWEEASPATMVIAAGRREGRQANDWRTFNEKRIKQANAGLFIQKLCEKNTQETTSVREFYPWIPKRFGAFVRDGPVRMRVMFASIDKQDFQISQRSISRHQNSQF